MRLVEYAFCRGQLRAWTRVAPGVYRCVCCGHRMKLVDTRRLLAAKEAA